MITQQETSNPSFRLAIVALSLIAVGLAWSFGNLPHENSTWMLALLLPAWFLLDKEVRVAWLGQTITIRHLLIAAAVLGLEPAMALWIAGGIVLGRLGAWLVRDHKSWARKINEDLPAFLAAWCAVLLPGFSYDPITIPKLFNILTKGILKLALFMLLLQGFSLIWTSEFRWKKISRRWKEHYASTTLIFLCLTLTLSFLEFFRVSAGWLVFLTTLPLMGLVVWFYWRLSRVWAEEASRQRGQATLQTSIIEALALAIDAKHRTTPGHARRVEIYSLNIARSLGVDNEEDLNALRTAALLHDIGELGVPDYLFSKPGKLTDAEFSRIARHAEIGADLLEPIDFPYPIVPLVRHHHERYDGSGYPYGLKGEEIPLGARILTVAESYDALTTQRPYKKAISHYEALAILKEESGIYYDPLVVEALIRVAPDLPQVASKVLPDMPEIAHSVRMGISVSPEESKMRMRRKSIEEISSAQREVFALYEMFQTVGSSLNVEETIQVICQKLQSLIPFTSCVVYLKDPKTDVARAALAVGEYSEYLSKNWVRSGEGPAGYAIAFNQPVVNTHPSCEFKNLLLYERPDELVNTLVFPLQAEEKVLGAIALYSTDANSPYTDDHVRLLEMVCGQAAVSIQNAQAFESYERNSLTDALTGLPNSRYMFLIYEQNMKKADRFNEKMAVLVMDLNGFKIINDQHGHQVGDEVLIEVSRVLQQEMRKYDTCIRYGGDEFVAFLYNADQSTAAIVMERIRQSVRDIRYKVASGQDLQLSISIGAAFYPENGSELSHLFTVADYQMYRDKHEGRNESAPALTGSKKVLSTLDLSNVPPA
jgi:diguanylate cyclase (GGDEF)-like protein/putative nucleotidyltransferase with HDIG domain